jgi:hypothetical protein
MRKYSHFARFTNLLVKWDWYISYYICYGIVCFIVRFNLVSKITVWDATPGSLALNEPGRWFQVDDARNRILRNVGTYQSRWSYSIIQLYSTYFRVRAIDLNFFYFVSCQFLYEFMSSNLMWIRTADDKQIPMRYCCYYGVLYAAHESWSRCSLPAEYLCDYILNSSPPAT